MAGMVTQRLEYKLWAPQTEGGGGLSSYIDSKINTINTAFEQFSPRDKTIIHCEYMQTVVNLVEYFL
jgi:hypothetical protein